MGILANIFSRSPEQQRKSKATRSAVRGFDAGSILAQIHDSSWRVAEDEDINNVIRGSNALIRQRARDHEKNSDFVRRYLNLLRTHVVGPRGITLQCAFKEPATGRLHTEINEHLESSFREWAERGSCDVTGRYSFVELQNMIITALARDGEALVIEHYGTQHNRFGYSLQLLDADALDETFDCTQGTYKIRSGIELDEWGRPRAYYIQSDDGRYTNGNGRRFTRVEASRVHHIYRAERAGQLRGVSWIVSSILSLRDLKGLMTAELISARVAAAKMGFYKREKTGGGDYKGEDIAKGFTRDVDGSLVSSATPGSFEILPEGVTVETVDFQHPHSSFADFVKTSLRGIASGLGISYNSLSNDLESVNYSSLRAGLLDERDGYMVLQEFLITSFVRPVYRAWLNTSVLSGSLDIRPKDTSKYLNPKFLGRRWAWVDPLKDTRAATEAINSGIRSRTDVASEAGKSFEDVVSELAAEENLMKAHGLSMAQKNKESGLNATDSDDNYGDDESTASSNNNA